MTLRKLILLAATSLLVPVISAQELPKVPRVKVMVLGTYHMDNPKRDFVKGEIDDHLSPRRQREVSEVVRLLEKFRPTKILVESVYGTPTINERYGQYLAGTLPPTADERVQIGMSLARKLKLDRLHPIDFKEDMDIASVMALAQKTNDRVSLERLGAGHAEVLRMMARLPKMTVRQALVEANSPKVERFTQALYNQMLRVADEPNNYRGVDVVAGWHHRNLRIFANIARSVQPADERVLVIIGSGHAPLLRQFVREAIDMEEVPVGKVLGEGR